MSQFNLISTMIVDLMVAGLLLVTIVYCWKLNKRIRILQDSKSELAQLIADFDESTQHASRSIAEIHAISKKINSNIKLRLEKANYIADDLAFMIEKGNKLADRMEGDIRKKPSGAAALEVSDEPGRVSARKRPTSSRGSARRAAPRDDDGMDSAEAEEIATRSRKALAEGDREGLENMLERIAAGKKEKKPAASSARKVRSGVRLKSKAEQELMDALKSEH